MCQEVIALGPFFSLLDKGSAECYLRISVKVAQNSKSLLPCGRTSATHSLPQSLTSSYRYILFEVVNQYFREVLTLKNPWEEIQLEDYEKHMKLDSVMQLQVMNEMMRDQFFSYPISSVMILGIAGGNGLEHMQKGNFKKVYGVDINRSYLQEVTRRYGNLDGMLECICIDLIKEPSKLPQADMVIANLLIEYIGYKCFQQAIQAVRPKYISCIIQVNAEGTWVSDSPYLHVFDKLDQVHHQIEEHALAQAMAEIGYNAKKATARPLPNGKKFIQMDFEKQSPIC